MLKLYTKREVKITTFLLCLCVFCDTIVDTMNGDTSLLPLPQIAPAQAGFVFDNLDVSELTRSDYKSRIPLFLKFHKNKQLNNNSYLDFKRYLSGRTDFTVSTKNKYLVSAKVFLKELNRVGAIPVEITQNIKGFTQSKKHKKDGLTQKEVDILVEKVNGLPDSPATHRLKAILSLLILQGLRQIEIVRLDVKDLDLVSKKAMVQGKGQDDKEMIDLHPLTIRTLREYLKTNNIKSGPLFQSKSNNNKNKRLSTRAIRGVVKELLTKIGIDKSTHGFRHYFTTQLIKSYKGDLLEVAQYTRHKSLEMLQVYNDSVKKEADLPRYYETFQEVNL